MKENKQTYVWLCENLSANVIELPVQTDQVIKTVALGMNHKIGITESGLLMTWIIPPTILVRKCIGFLKS